MDKSDSGLCPMMGFGISGFEPPSSITRELVASVTHKCVLYNFALCNQQTDIILHSCISYCLNVDLLLNTHCIEILNIKIIDINT